MEDYARKGFRSYRRWDLGPKTCRVAHPLDYRVFLPGRPFALCYDLVWEISVAGDRQWLLEYSPFWEFARSDRWDDHADDVHFFCERIVDFHDKVLGHRRLLEGPLKHLSWYGDTVLWDTVEYIKRTGFREPVPHDLRLRWIIDRSIARDPDQTACRFSDFPLQVVEGIRRRLDFEEPDGGLVLDDLVPEIRKWLQDRRINQEKYDRLVDESGHRRG